MQDEQLDDLARGVDRLGNLANTMNDETTLHVNLLNDLDSSVDRGQPIDFPLNGVNRGWTEGVGSMKVGGKRKLIIPPDLGYGARGAGGVIPPKATLVFDVELLDVQN